MNADVDPTRSRIVRSVGRKHTKPEIITRRALHADDRKRRELEKLGWKVETVWECETRSPSRLIERLKDFLGLTVSPD